LERVCFRVGLVVAIRAKITGLLGVMITASHNQHEDNGVKIVERDGSMLNVDWEPIAETIVNSKNIAETISAFTPPSDKDFNIFKLAAATDEV